jgi:hypothetical protein
MILRATCALAQALLVARNVIEPGGGAVLRILASVVVTLMLSASWSLPARAVLVTGTFSGQIFSGSDFGVDPAGYFGAGTDLTDLPITGTFRYDTTRVPLASSSGGNSALYSDPTFATDFLELSVTINGRTYTLGGLAAPPGIQSLEVIDNTDQLAFDYQRFGVDASEALGLRFISDLDFLVGTGVPTQFNFIASGVGLTPGGTFSFDLPDGSFASASFAIDSGFAVAAVPEPSTLASVILGLIVLATARRTRRDASRTAATPACS